MSGGQPRIPARLHREVAGTARLLKGLVHPSLPLTLEAPTGVALEYLASRALPDTVRRQIRCRSAVYTAWDVQGQCRYVGSVCRGGATAVGDRLAEHFRYVAKGQRRRADWALLTVIPIRPDAPLDVVRAAEGWAARRLAPLDGSAHPRIELDRPPSVLARELDAHRLVHI
ncbi:hypothetical protein [Streptomyces gardneri]|uniref:GIY-YIG domain-containing protein n=1 Tax=Streptomyces gardneri TaxID=66892 RepID=A0A4Y3RSL7_9ACTN|nr:hypothetical protein [Streptomyces gardneri]GEB60068.1 hypothetical protein SGA01_56730 [Streptomyces gardneri]GHH21106.1 hypothetical protein GCM10017674_75520 [Streptomyces gardneri]